MNSLIRVAIPAGWMIVAYLAFFADVGGPLRIGTTALFWLLVATHVVEVAVLENRLRRVGQPFLLSDLVLTLVYGIFYLTPRVAPLRGADRAM